MFTRVSRLMFGTRNERQLKKLRALVAEINAFEPAIAALDDAALTAKTAAFKERLAAGDTLDQILPEAYAVVREAAKRTLGLRAFDVQLMGGIALHQGKIAEMRTGEGKTLVSTFPTYLNALTGDGVHIITVNDYLAKRDSDEMGRVHRFLGLSVGCIQHDMDEQDRMTAYRSAITYGTNNEFGFDYLRDHLKFRQQDLVQRPFHFAIIDEADSILIDEARTPLIISGPAEDTSDLYIKIDALVAQLPEDAVEKDEKMKIVNLTEDGVNTVEELLRSQNLMEADTHLYDLVNMSALHHVNMALRARFMFRRDKDYLVKDDKVIIIDEFTGRMMAGRRYSEGQHQALEAKEGVTIQPENQTVASITLQNYFRLYPKIAGMTGTALTEAKEFTEIYNLDVIDIPTHRDVVRADQHDEIYRTEAEKNQAIITLVQDAQARQQPVLVGTTSIEKSEELAQAFRKAGITHHVLNARHHEQEAFIVAQAGRPGAVTIATNMAGRGTDIKLGGNAEMLVQHQLAGGETPEQIDAVRARIKQQVATDADTVKAAGGLYVVGSERHESRRIDNQLRGRSGRQGDPGASKFFLSLQDDLMRIFGSERLDAMLQRLGLKPGEAIFHPWISKAIENAQKKVEAQHFDARRELLRKDNVMNDQRKVVYELRRDLMGRDDVSDTIETMLEDAVADMIEQAIPAGSYKEQWDVDGLTKAVKAISGHELPIRAWADEEGADEAALEDKILAALSDQWLRIQNATRTMIMAAPDMFRLEQTDDLEQAATDYTRDIERSMILHGLDKAWKDHLYHLDHVRQGINLRQYGQRDPLNEYRAEAFHLFQLMLGAYRDSVLTALLRDLEKGSLDDLEALQRRQRQIDRQMKLQETRVDPAMPEMLPPADIIGFPAKQQTRAAAGRVVRPVFDQMDPETWAATPRNNPCPCGSGKKYKHCHGKMLAEA